MNVRVATIILACSLLSQRVLAQSTSSDINFESEVEQVYDKFENDEKKRKEKDTVKTQEQKKARPDLTSLSELGTLAPFEDIAVIQRRFLPKTGRFEASAAGLTGLNNPFFSTFGLGARFGYYFREKYGVEVIYDYLATAKRDVTKNLRNKRQIETSSFVSPEEFFGAAFKWNPFYGKMTFLNSLIVPFDISFHLGAGMTKTNAGRQEFTFLIGTSQVYALSKSWAFRWDLRWNFYQAQSIQENGTTRKGSQDDLTLTVGMSFFFPEATYR